MSSSSSTSIWWSIVVLSMMMCFVTMMCESQTLPLLSQTDLLNRTSAATSYHHLLHYTFSPVKSEDTNGIIILNSAAMMIQDSGFSAEDSALRMRQFIPSRTSVDLEPGQDIDTISTIPSSLSPNNVMHLSTNQYVYLQNTRSFTHIRNALIQNHNLEFGIRFRPPQFRYSSVEYCLLCIRREEHEYTSPMDLSVPHSVCDEFDFAITLIKNRIRVYINHEMPPQQQQFPSRTRRCSYLSHYVQLRTSSAVENLMEFVVEYGAESNKIRINQQDVFPLFHIFKSPTTPFKTFTTREFDSSNWAAFQSLYIGPLGEFQFDMKFNTPIILNDAYILSSSSSSKQPESTITHFPKLIDKFATKCIHYPDKHVSRCPTHEYECIPEFCQCAHTMMDPLNSKWTITHYNITQCELVANLLPIHMARQSPQNGLSVDGGGGGGNKNGRENPRILSFIVDHIISNSNSYVEAPAIFDSNTTTTTTPEKYTFITELSTPADFLTKAPYIEILTPSMNSYIRVPAHQTTIHVDSKNTSFNAVTYGWKISFSLSLQEIAELYNTTTTTAQSSNVYQVVYRISMLGGGIILKYVEHTIRFQSNNGLNTIRIIETAQLSTKEQEPTSRLNKYVIQSYTHIINDELIWNVDRCLRSSQDSWGGGDDDKHAIRPIRMVVDVSKTTSEYIPDVSRLIQIQSNLKIKRGKLQQCERSTWKTQSHYFLHHREFHKNIRLEYINDQDRRRYTLDITTRVVMEKRTLSIIPNALIVKQLNQYKKEESISGAGGYKPHICYFVDSERNIPMNQHQVMMNTSMIPNRIYVHAALNNSDNAARNDVSLSTTTICSKSLCPLGNNVVWTVQLIELCSIETKSSEYLPVSCMSPGAVRRTIYDARDSLNIVINPNYDIVIEPRSTASCQSSIDFSFLIHMPPFISTQVESMHLHFRGNVQKHTRSGHRHDNNDATNILEEMSAFTGEMESDISTPERLFQYSSYSNIHDAIRFTSQSTSDNSINLFGVSFYRIPIKTLAVCMVIAIFVFGMLSILRKMNRHSEYHLYHGDSLMNSNPGRNAPQTSPPPPQSSSGSDNIWNPLYIQQFLLYQSQYGDGVATQKKNQ